MPNPASADPGIWSRNDILALLAILTGILIAIVTILVMKSIDRKARHRALDERPITQNTPRDFKALASLCVSAAQSGLQTMEPWIRRKQLDDLLSNIPSRLVLVGSRGSGESRIATEAVKRLQLGTERNILFWQQQLPSRGSLSSFNPHRPILIVDDLQRGSRKTDETDDDESDAVGAHLAKLVARLAEQSGENEDSINVILTIWPDHLDWLKNELGNGSKFQFVDVANPSDDEKRQYVRSVERDFQPVTLSADAVDEVVKCSTYRDIFRCLRSLANQGITQPTVSDVENERRQTWRNELNSFEPRERLLFNILMVLGQFRLATDQREVEALYRAGVRGVCCDRLTCQDAVTGTATALRRSLVKFDSYCQHEFHRMIAELERKRYVGIESSKKTTKEPGGRRVLFAFLGDEPNHP